ncbi:rRNA maturation RNase YbeY [Oceanibaculum nanhaiense]|uniref:rRNA maturation RNase YbeY n=1 Tax=Oceanibaculum nanhaiense TaxID=1909734 RepID=UPI00396E6E89
MSAAALEVAVDVADPAWQAAVPGLEGLVERAALAALAEADTPDGPAELAVRLTDDAELQALNRQYCGKDRPTNVLSFPGDADDALPGEPTPLGDLALAYGTVAREASEQGKSLADHLSHLIVHGTLHVLGYDHETEAEAAEMEALEVRILSGFGISDPYLLGPAAQAGAGFLKEA